MREASGLSLAPMQDVGSLPVSRSSIRMLATSEPQERESKSTVTQLEKSPVRTSISLKKGPATDGTVPHMVHSVKQQFDWLNSKRPPTPIIFSDDVKNLSPARGRNNLSPSRFSSRNVFPGVPEDTDLPPHMATYGRRSNSVAPSHSHSRLCLDSEVSQSSSLDELPMVALRHRIEALAEDADDALHASVMARSRASPARTHPACSARTPSRLRQQMDSSGHLIDSAVEELPKRCSMHSALNGSRRILGQSNASADVPMNSSLGGAGHLGLSPMGSPRMPPHGRERGCMVGESSSVSTLPSPDLHARSCDKIQNKLNVRHSMAGQAPDSEMAEDSLSSFMKVV